MPRPRPEASFALARVRAASSALSLPRKPQQTRVTRKAENIRQHILDTALRLFQERGYDGATMRAVADQAGVALGNAYYYFPSKEHLIRGFYAHMHEEHLAAAVPALEGQRDLRRRIETVLTTKIDTSEPYHRSSAHLFKTAADPQSPLNPFSEQPAPVRAQAIALFESVLDGADTKIPADLRARRPELLWLFEMAVILFWIHDRSAERARTRRLIAGTVQFVGKLISIASFPLMRPPRKSALALLDDLCGIPNADAPSAG